MPSTRNHRPSGHPPGGLHRSAAGVLPALRRTAAAAIAASLGATALMAAAPMGAGSSDFTGTTLGAYLQRAAEANPDVQAFADRYRAAMQRVPQAGALPDPSLQVTHYVQKPMMGAEEQTDDIMLMQMVPWFGKLGRRKAVASAEAEALGFAFERRQLAVAQEVSQAFFEYGYTGKSAELTRENLDLLRRLQSAVEERVRGGGDLNQLLRLQVEIGKTGNGLKTLEQMRVAQSARLAGLLAISADGPLPWPEWEAPQPEPVDRATALAALEHANPELAMLDRSIASAEAARALARLEGFPDLTVGVNYMRVDAIGAPAMDDAGRDPWGVVVGVTLPIWGGRYKAAREEARFSQSAAVSERRDRENMLKAELTSTVASLDDAHRRLKVYGEELLGLARQALDVTLASYEGGGATILDVIDSERSLLELQLEYWRAAADAWQQRVALQVLTNQPIAGIHPPAGTP